MSMEMKLHNHQDVSNRQKPEPRPPTNLPDDFFEYNKNDKTVETTEAKADIVKDFESDPMINQSTSNSGQQDKASQVDFPEKSLKNQDSLEQDVKPQEV